MIITFDYVFTGNSTNTVSPFDEDNSTDDPFGSPDSSKNPVTTDATKTASSIITILSALLDNQVEDENYNFGQIICFSCTLFRKWCRIIKMMYLNMKRNTDLMQGFEGDVHGA